MRNIFVIYVNIMLNLFIQHQFHDDITLGDVKRMSL